MKRHLKLHVQQMFLGKEIPDSFNRKYFPSRRDIAQLIYRTSSKLAQGMTDLEALAGFVADNADESFLRLPGVNGEQLLLVYQNEWQRKLLLRYGNHLSLMDATYKTMRYAVPLYQIVVKTNVGYSTVATFVVQKEDVASLTQALQVLCEWNPTWRPFAFMVDGDEKEEAAINALFPGKCGK